MDNHSNTTFEEYYATVRKALIDLVPNLDEDTVRDDYDSGMSTDESIEEFMDMYS